MTKKKVCAIVIVSIVFVAIIVTLAVLIRGQRVSDYSVDEHVSRITERARERYIENGEYTDLKVYPLYDANDKFTDYCVIELQPTGYVFIQISDVNLLLHIFGANGMYSRCNDNPIKSWQRYRIANDDNLDSITDGETQWVYQESSISNGLYETDDSGEFIYYTVSPYKAADVGDQRRYLLQISGNSEVYIPSIKTDNAFLNLISMEQFEYDKSLNVQSCPCLYLGAPPKNEFDL